MLTYKNFNLTKSSYLVKYPLEKLFLKVFTFIFLLLFLSVSFAQGKGENVKFQDYPGPGNLMAKVAIEKGFCSKYEIKCQLQVLGTGPLGIQALLSKSIDAAFVTAPVMIGPISQGAKLKMVVGGSTANPAMLIFGDHITVSNSNYTWPSFMANLSGKKIGVPARGSLMEFKLRWMLLKSGMKIEDIIIVAVGGPDTAYGALISKQVDALMTFPPADSLCEVLGTCKVVWRASTDKQPAEFFALNGGGNGIVFTQDFIDSKPHVIDAVTKAFKDADYFINNPNNYDEVIRITKKYYRIDTPNGDDVIKHIIKIAIDSKTFTAPLNRKAMQGYLDFMIETKMVDKAPALNLFITPDAP